MLKVLLLNTTIKEISPGDASALLQSAETLEQITWNNALRTDALVALIEALKRLNYLFIPAAELTDEDIPKLRALTLLRSLNFRGSKLTDTGARHLAKLAPLARLFITDALDNGAAPLTPEGLALITKQHGNSLTEINIGSHGSPHTDGMLRAIASDCPVLEGVIFRGNTSPEALASLSKLKKLKRIDFGRTSGKPIPLSVAHCQGISGIKSLETVGISDCALTDEHVQALSGLKSIKSINLNRNQGITDTSVPVILGFQELEAISLGDTKLTPAGVLKLTVLKKLKTLSISNKDFTDAHIAQFKAAQPGCTISR